MRASDDVRLARAYLLRVAEPPAPALAALVAVVGPVAAADRVRRGDCPAAVRDETAARRGHDLAARDLEQAAEAGARLVVPEDGEWPAWPLLSLSIALDRGVSSAVPPLALWAGGEVGLDDAVERAVAVVGARAASEYGEHHAAEFGYGLADRGVPVCSGAAYGIDGAAHRGALVAFGNRGEECDRHDPDRHASEFRSGGRRHRDEPGAPRRQRHRPVIDGARARGEAPATAA